MTEASAPQAHPAVSTSATGSSSSPSTYSAHRDVSRGHGLSLVFWLMEQRWPTLLAIPTVIATLAYFLASGSWLAFGLTWFAVPLLGIVLPLLRLIYRSRQDDAGAAEWENDIQWTDPADAARWRGKKIPMERVYEAYMDGKLDFRGDVYETMLRRNKIFRFCFTWGDVKFYFKDFIRQNTSHSVKSDHGDIAHVYNRGNDFYNWFLGDGMVYTSGIFQDPEESLETAQERKLETVCKYTQMQAGDRHLDIGCGWGPLITHAAQHYGTDSTGITLAQEQAEWAEARAEKAGVADRVKVLVDDYRKIPAAKYDKITCLEMAEHVGIKNFQKFLMQVNELLEDDGIFYLQIAGLRRPWQYEDLVWGLFMAKYIFPGADASCPLGFVVNQAERAGFEVHRVENCGVHYSLTIHKWYENWKRNEEVIVAKYGQRWFRKWMIFLSWSVIIAAQGSSTVFMITMSKNTKNDKSSVSAEEAKRLAYSRQERWIGPNPVGTQQ